MPKLKSAARRDSAIFARVWRESVVPGPHQYEMAEWADDGDIRYQGEFWPRDHGKSEIFCIAYPLRRVCENPDIRILIVQKTAGEAEKTLQVIKTELERNAALKRYYADHWEQTVGVRDISNATGTIYREGEREGAWQRRRIYCKRNRKGKDPTVEAVGVGGAITGGHFDVIILDDVEDDENTKTEDRLKTLREWFTGTILQLREPHTKTIIVGTPKTSQRDIYNFILDNPMWACRETPAILSHDIEEIDYEPIHDEEESRIVDVRIGTDDVKVLWPAQWPLRELLLDMLGSIRSIWLREKMLDLRAMAGTIFKRDWFRYQPLDQFPDTWKCEQLIQVWDTAFEEDESADWSVCGTIGLQQGKAYIYNIFRKRLEFPDLVNLRNPDEGAIVRQYSRWAPQEVLIEKRASGRSALQVLKRETKLPVLEVTPGGKDKPARARAVTPYYEAGRVVHPLDVAWLETFEDELTMFPDAAHDDQVDVLVYGLLRLFTSDIGPKAAVLRPR